MTVLIESTRFANKPIELDNIQYLPVTHTEFEIIVSHHNGESACFNREKMNRENLFSTYSTSI